MPDHEKEIITDPDELNKLYALKIGEELAEIRQSDHKDIMEFADLVEACYSFAKVNGFDRMDINQARIHKHGEKGSFENIALTALNPENPSNAIYFDDVWRNF